MSINIRIFFLLFITIFVKQSFAQEVAIGQWREHLPYHSAISVADADDKVFCATEFSLFSYNKAEDAIEKYSKINGLSDFKISKISYSENQKALVIAYQNANIDIIKNNVIYNVSDIKRKNIIGDKRIYSIHFIDEFAYLGCGFGIVVLNLNKLEIKDTYYIGNLGKYLKVNDISSSSDEIIAATDDGLYKASLFANNLADYNEWQKDTTLEGTFNAIDYFNGHFVTNKVGQVYNTDTVFVLKQSGWTCLDSTKTLRLQDINHGYNKLLLVYDYSICVYDTNHNFQYNIYTYYFSSAQPREVVWDLYSEDMMWIADNKNGLIKCVPNFSIKRICPDGPGSSNVVDMDIRDGNLVVATGGIDQSWHNLYNKNGVYYYNGTQWHELNKNKIPEMDTVFDVITVKINPQNSSEFYAGSWGRGVVQFNENNYVERYTESNTSNALKPIDNPTMYFLSVSGINIDEYNNLWLVNSGTTSPIVVKKANGQWQSFFLGASFNSIEMKDLIIDDYGQKWVIKRNDGLLVFSDNNTIDDITDDDYEILSNQPGTGNLPSTHVNCIAKDLDNEIWVGTDEGIAVIYTPEEVFSGGDYDAQRIIIEQDGHAQYLLESEIITDIAIDGANKKWIGTQNAGIFYMSEDGSEQIYHFDTDNSLLFSNTITCIAIDNESGEVFIGTDKGIISYRGEATEGKEEYTDVYAFPNPVMPEYDGKIAIKGLVTDANVKITDISGTIVFETIAKGGQAIWNGRNYSGRKAQSGVYLVFCTNEDGTQTFVTKIMIIN